MENRLSTKWVLDPTHSELLFKVKHLMITNVKGEFRNFSAGILSEGNNFEKAKLSVRIDAASIFTNNNDRDAHLGSGDFFETEQFPSITFEGTSLEKTAGEDFQLTGLLTIKGVTKSITLDVEFGGINKDPWGNEKAGFSLEGRINRKDWGLNWNAALETGGVLVSEEVRIQGEVQFVKQA
jgi:polyisoprenoid-binding protein YceI